MRRRWWTPLAGASAGLGLWASTGALDVGAGKAAGEVARIAMLPPLWQLALYVAAGAALAMLVFRGRLAGAAWPLFVLPLLAVPYLPWLADEWPALRAAAGPARGALWWVVGWLVVVHLVTTTIATTARAVVLTPLLIFVLSAGIFGGVAWRLTTGGLFPGGDEPHYLVITQSLISDGDLKIENNHARGDYRAYFPLELAPHYLNRGIDGEIYSVHPIGLAVLAVPAFWLGGYPGVVAMLVLVAALAATLLWGWARHVTGSAEAATFGWAAAALTTPFLFNSFTVFPEVTAGLAVLIALAWRPDSSTIGVLVVRGLAIAALPWLSTKYAPMAGVVGLVVMLRSVRSVRAALAVGIPPALSLAGWFLFFYAYWGTFSPSAPYGSQQNMALGYLARGGPGLLFDQEYGVMALAPVLTLALVGLVLMVREGGAAARRAAEVIAVFAALLVTVGAFHIWWGGSAAPGRPVAAAVLLLGLPVAWTYARVRAANATALRAGCHLLLAGSLGIALTLLAVRQGALLNNGRDGSAVLLEWLSPTWPIWPAFPSFIIGPIGTALGITAAWLVLFAVVALVVRTAGTTGVGGAGALAAGAGAVGAVAIVSSLATSPGPAPETRARIPFLDDFDAARRPVGIVYEPFSVVSIDEVLARLAYTGESGRTTGGGQPPLLWNTRLALPAGRYRLQIMRDVEAPDVLGLQVGREGHIHRQWHVAGPVVDEELVVPVDVVYAGFRASGDFGRGSLRVTPLAVVDRSRRPDMPDVTRVVRYGDIDVFVHDERVGGEPEGFWTLAGRSTFVTFAADAQAPDVLMLDVRCGPVANQMTLSTPDWRETIAVEAGGSVRVAVPLRLEPAIGRRLAPLELAVRGGYVPADFDPASRDTRMLGCWVQMPAPRDSARRVAVPAA